MADLFFVNGMCVRASQILLTLNLETPVDDESPLVTYSPADAWQDQKTAGDAATTTVSELLAGRLSLC